MYCYVDLKEIAVEICTASCSLVWAYHEARKGTAYGKMYEKTKAPFRRRVSAVPN